MKKLLIVLGVIVVGYLLIQWSRADFLAFAERREDWHRRCDAYVGSNATIRDDARAADCRRELDELMAYAKRKGWAE